MDDQSKITLSDNELGLVCNKEWILTKNNIIEKVYRLFGKLALRMQQQVGRIDDLPQQAKDSNPKIARGENYRGLPYVMLDYPRHFTKGSTLAIRTLFWWGNFFSINLHLSGTCKEQAIPTLAANFTSLQQEGYWLCVHGDPWQHHFEEDNYVPLENYTAAEFTVTLYREPFIKIAKWISLEHWEAAEEFLEGHFNNMTGLLKISFPGDERDLSPGIPITGSGL